MVRRLYRIVCSLLLFQFAWSCQEGLWRCFNNDRQECYGGEFHDVPCPQGTICDRGNCVWPPVAIPTTAMMQCPTSTLPPGVSANSNLTRTYSPPTPSNGTTVAPSKPVLVMYVSDWGLPPVSELGMVTHLIIGFWTTKGIFGAAEHWASDSSVATAYQSAGITVMIAAFGSSDFPTSDKIDAQNSASNVAKFVVDNGFDGVDVDYEDVRALESGTAVDWLVLFHNTLRQLLPAGYLITHAPVAPWFVSSKYMGGGYSGLHKRIGDTVDWYNVQVGDAHKSRGAITKILQFYNQPGGAYQTCETLLHQSGGQFSGSSLFELNRLEGIPLNKLAIGKLASPADGISSVPGTQDTLGYMPPEALKVCMNQARSEGWGIRLCIWQWHAGNQFFEQVLAGTNDR